MTLAEYFIKFSMTGVNDFDKQADSAVKSGDKLSGTLKKGLTTAAKTATAALAGATAAIVKIAKASVSAYADYEQLVGGVDTLFKGASKKVQKYAEDAFKTAGVSANDYMEMATAFSATLIQNLKGDTEKAADLANLAITDMSDNVNKMGTSMEMVQNAYRGLSMSNFMMLDNLKLGYQGNAAEMARLINDSGVLGDKMKATADNVKQIPFSTYIEAIHKIQEEIGITGTTALEASTTITGSWTSVKAAWENFITGLANPNADLGKLITNVVDTAGTAVGNVIPKVQSILQSIPSAITGLSGKITPVIIKLLPDVIQGATVIAIELAKQLPTILSVVFESLRTTVNTVGEELAKAFPSLSFAFENLESVIMGVVAALGAYKTAMAIVGIINAFRTALVSAQAAQEGVTAAQVLLNMVMEANPIVLIITLIAGLVAALVTLYMTNEDFRNKVQEVWESVKETVSTVIEAVKGFFTSAVEFLKGVWEDIKSVFTTAINFIKDLFTFFKNLTIKDVAYFIGYLIGKILNFYKTIILNTVDFVKSIPEKLKILGGKIKDWATSTIETLKEFFTNLPDKAKTLMTNIKDKIVNGFKSMWEKTKTEVPNKLDELKGWFEELPDKIKEIGKNIVDGLLNGIKEKWESFKETVSGLFNSFVGGVEDGLGIASPSKVFARIGRFTAEGFEVGYEDEMNDITNRMSTYVPDNLPTTEITSSGDDFLQEALNELVYMFKYGTAKTSIDNTRDLRRVINA